MSFLGFLCFLFFSCPSTAAIATSIPSLVGSDGCVASTVLVSNVCCGSPSCSSAATSTATSTATSATGVVDLDPLLFPGLSSPPPPPSLPFLGAGVSTGLAGTAAGDGPTGAGDRLSFFLTAEAAGVLEDEADGAGAGMGTGTGVVLWAGGGTWSSTLLSAGGRNCFTSDGLSFFLTAGAATAGVLEDEADCAGAGMGTGVVLWAGGGTWSSILLSAGGGRNCFTSDHMVSLDCLGIRPRSLPAVMRLMHVSQAMETGSAVCPAAGAITPYLLNPN